MPRALFSGLLAILCLAAVMAGPAQAMDRQLPDATVLVPYSEDYTVLTTPHGCGNVTYGNPYSSLPDGMTFTDTSSGTVCSFRLSGTPTTAKQGAIRFCWYPQGGDPNPPDAIVNSGCILSYYIGFNINKASPSLSLTASPSPATYLNTTTITATLSSASAATGLVTFRDAGTEIGTASVANGVASLSLSTLSVGTHILSASYEGDSSNNPAVADDTNSGTISLVVNKDTPDIALYPASTSITVDKPATYAVKVTSVSGPTGTVSLMDGATTIASGPLASSGLTLLSGSLGVGSHDVTAVYGGDELNETVTSAAETIIVGKAVPALTLAASATSTNSGAPVTFTASLTGGAAPTGVVSFMEGATTIANVSVTGAAASFTTTSLGVGSHTIKAVYAGDSGNAGATSATASLTVGKGRPAIKLIASGTSVKAGSPVVLAASVSGGKAPSGTVTFLDGTTSIGTATLSGGGALLTAPKLTLGAHAFKAVYAGDTNNATATSASVTVTIVQATPSVTLTPSATTIKTGTQVTLVASLVGGSAPGGSVKFYDGATLLGTKSISGSAASFATTSLKLGSHALKAVYAGDANNKTATSAVVTISVAKTLKRTTTSTALIASATHMAPGTPIVLTATTATTVKSTQVLTGTVTFRDGDTVLGIAPLNAGSARLTVSLDAAGTHDLTAVYGGDRTFDESRSRVVAATVDILDGKPFPINTVTTGQQENPALARLASGNLLAAWQTDTGTRAGNDIHAQLITAAGRKAGIERVINTTTGGEQTLPVVVGLAGGGSVVIWQSSDGSRVDLRAQVLAASGAAVGGEITVHADTLVDDVRATAVALPSGGFAVAWAERDASSAPSTIHAARFGATGNRLSADIPVSAPSRTSATAPALATLGTDSLVAVWQTGIDKNGAGTLAARLFAADGSSTGPEVTLDPGISAPLIAGASDGGLTLLWSTPALDGKTVRLRGRHYDAALKPTAAAFAIDAAAAFSRIQASVAPFPKDNGFAVAWTRTSAGGNGKVVSVQRFSASGRSAGGATKLSIAKASTLTAPALAVLDAEHFIVAVTATAPLGQQGEIYGQRLRTKTGASAIH